MKTRILNFKIDKEKNFSLLALMALLFILLGSFVKKKNFINDDYIVRRLSYEQLLTTTFAISNDVNVDEMHPFDILNARSSTERSTIDVIIDQDGKMSFTRVFQLSEEDQNHEFQRPAKSVSDETGTRLYDATGSEIYQLLHDNSNPFPSFYGTPEELSKYGLKEAITGLSAEEINTFTYEGSNVVINENGQYVIYDDSRRLTIDPIAQTLFYEFFKESSLTNSLLEKYAIISGEMVIRILTIENFYSTLINGGMFEKTVRTEFSNYKVNDVPVFVEEAVYLNTGNSIEKPMNSIYTLSSSFDVQNLSFSNIFSVHPNLGNDQITILLSNTNTSNLNEYTIFSVDGKMVNSGIIALNNPINISKLNSGVYLITLKTAEGIFHSQFIKK